MLGKNVLKHYIKRSPIWGAVNLAAAEELASETQRQQYLEAQYTDLKEALTTLDNAIKKIDRETKAKFEETFKQINGNFISLFPKLFGGGKAYMEIVGDELIRSWRNSYGYATWEKEFNYSPVVRG